jgi:hypothetical protein
MEPNGELSETIYASVSEASPKTLAQRKFTLFKESEESEPPRLCFSGFSAIFANYLGPFHLLKTEHEICPW